MRRIEIRKNRYYFTGDFKLFLTKYSVECTNMYGNYGGIICTKEYRAPIVRYGNDVYAVVAVRPLIASSKRNLRLRNDQGHQWGGQIKGGVDPLLGGQRQLPSLR